MSHFTVLVVGENPEVQLAPFHEFECTGINDQYVQTIDVTEHLRKEYAGAELPRVKGPDDKLYHTGDSQFYRDPVAEELEQLEQPLPIFGMVGWSVRRGIGWWSKDWGDGKGIRPKMFDLPKGFARVSVPAKEVMTFREWLKYWTNTQEVEFGNQPDIEGEHMAGYTMLTKDGDVDKVFERTSPNAKWNWFTIGGRWHGFFKLKDGPTATSTGRLGKFGVQLFGKDYVKPTEPRADSAPKMAIDFEGMRKETSDKAEKRYDDYKSLTEGTPQIVPFAEIQKKHPDDIDAAREEYKSQPAFVACRNADFEVLNFEEFLCSRDEYIERARAGAVATFAVLKDGQWYERGEVGWWDVVSDEREHEWQEEFEKLLDSLPETTLLTVVDCHI